MLLKPASSILVTATLLVVVKALPLSADPSAVATADINTPTLPSFSQPSADYAQDISGKASTATFNIKDSDEGQNSKWGWGGWGNGWCGSGCGWCPSWCNWWC